MNLLPQRGPVTEALDGLLSEVQLYGKNVKQLNWTPELRHFGELKQMLAPLQQATHLGSEMLANRLIELGGHPSPDTEAVMTRYLVPAIPAASFSDATLQVLHDSQQLLKAIRDTFQVAAEYNDQATMQLLIQSAHYVQNTIWTFSALRSAVMN